MGSLMVFYLASHLANGSEAQLATQRSLRDVKAGLTGRRAGCFRQMVSNMALEIAKTVTWPAIM
jgi:hypothetical protein